MSAILQTKIQKIQNAAKADNWETVRLLGGDIIISPEVSKDWRVLYEGYVIDPNRIFRSDKTYMGYWSEVVLPLARP